MDEATLTLKGLRLGEYRDFPMYRAHDCTWLYWTTDKQTGRPILATTVGDLIRKIDDKLEPF